MLHSNLARAAGSKNKMEGLIRKIVVGRDPKDGMAYFVGMKAGGGNVSAIVLDEEFLYRHGKTRYLVYIREDNAENLWKSVVDMPCMIEYDLKF